jgi:hypothetical protein
MAETVSKCQDGYRAVERRDRLGGGGYGEDNRGNRWTVHRSLITPEEWTNY